MSSGYAPVAVFAYKRADHLARCLESLARNREATHTDLYIFSDGPRTPQDSGDVERVRTFLASIRGFASVTPVLRPRNFGLAASIVSGTSEVLARHDRVIAVEDDLLLSPHFLDYMNRALERYASEPRVASIHGYCYPVSEKLPEIFFLRGADCWGWATWARAWRDFNQDGSFLLSELRRRGLTRAFDLDGAYPFTRMLEEQVAGRNDSWAVRWHASCFLQDKLTLYPGRSLVRNIGNDGSGTHSMATDQFDGSLAQEPITIGQVSIEQSAQARQAIIRFLRPAFLHRLFRAVWRFVTR